MSTNAVLLIEDDLVTQAVVQSTLREICRLETAGTGAAAFEKLAAGAHFDLILLDVNLPDMDGFGIYEKLRGRPAYRHTPIIFLTARGEREDRVKGFSLGADDYVVKPFDLIEFRSRISAKLRNLSSRQSVGVSENLVYGPYTVTPVTQKILVDRGGKSSALDLTANQFKILFYLLRHHDRVVPREEILREIWGEGVHVSNRTIDTHVYSIRQNLGDLASHLRSVHGVGYCLSLNPEEPRKAS